MAATQSYDRGRAPAQPMRLTPKQVETIEKVLGYATLIAVACLLVLPLYWMLATALKTPEQTFALPPEWVPNPMAWDNFVRVFEEVPFGRFILNTVILVALNIVGELFAVTLVAYGFARLRFPGRSILFLLMLSTMIPYHVTLVPRFILFSRLGWVNTYLPLFVPAFTGSSFLIFMVRQYMMSIPFDLDEAAYIDGATPLQLFRVVYIPLMAPSLVAVGIYAVLLAWNEYLYAFLLLSKETDVTLAVGLGNFLLADDSPWELLMATGLIYALPPAVIYYVFRKYMASGLTQGAVKS